MRIAVQREQSTTVVHQVVSHVLIRSLTVAALVRQVRLRGALQFLVRQLLAKRV
jgi:hypothetical protein